MEHRALACGPFASDHDAPKSLSLPSRHHPDDTAPALRKVPGKVCPKCRSRYDDVPVTCPRDGMHLINTSDYAEAAGDTMLGRTLDGRFIVLARLGSGSMGTVYRAKQQPMGRDVAIKILRSDRSLDEASKARFLREARTNSVLVSPHTVTVFDFGESESGLFLAMELLDGESVGQRITRVKRLPADAAVDVVRQTLLSLAEAHAKGIVHRDLKPDNLFFARVVTSEGKKTETVKVLDFGIAKMLGDNIEMNAIETQAGTVFGTPRYMSPEQAQAKTLDGRTDLYSLGVILYHMLTGRPPFTDDDAIIVMARHIKSSPKPFSEVCPEARIAPELERVVMRALSKDPAGRPDNAEAMARELAAAMEASRAVASGMRPSLHGAAQTVPLPRSSASDSLELAAVAMSSARLPRALLAVGGVAIVALATALFIVWPRNDKVPTPQTAPTQVVVTPSATAPQTAAPIVSNTTVATGAPPHATIAKPGQNTTHPTVAAPSSGRHPVVPGVKSTASAAPSASVRYGTLE